MTVHSRIVWGLVGTVATVLAMGSAGRAQQGRQHRIVFEVTGEGAQAWESVLNNVENAGKALGSDATEIRVVTHGKGVGLLLKTNTALAPRIEGLSSGRVKFVACENTMRRQKITKEDLQPIAGTVDSGVAEVVRLQEAGWSYIKSGS
jgi:uncharacterized protein